AVAEAFARLRCAARAQSTGSGPPLVYINRDDRPRGRILTNEADLVAALERMGFVSINPARLDYRDEIALFRAARMIIAAHGSGLANVGFAPSDCTVLEISPDVYVQPWIFDLTALLGQKFIYVIAETSSVTRH